MTAKQPDAGICECCGQSLDLTREVLRLRLKLSNAEVAIEHAHAAIGFDEFIIRHYSPITKEELRAADERFLRELPALLRPLIEKPEGIPF